MDRQEYNCYGTTAQELAVLIHKFTINEKRLTASAEGTNGETHVIAGFRISRDRGKVVLGFIDIVPFPQLGYVRLGCKPQTPEEFKDYITDLVKHLSETIQVEPIND